VASSRSRSSVDTALAVVLVLECIGALGVAVRSGHALELGGTAVALAAALVVAALHERRAAYVVAGWFLWDAALETVVGTDPLSSLELACHAARYGVALAVAQPRMATPILRVAASLTFLGHGIEALALKPIFLAYLQHTGGLVGLPLADDAAAVILRVIGSVDLVVATTLLWRGPRPLLTGYMSAWGIITALARVVYSGPAGLADALIRAANGGIPLALWLGLREREPDRPAPASESKPSKPSKR
jgi:hypothetical protein